MTRPVTTRAVGARYTEAVNAGRMAFGVFCCMDGYAVSHIFAASGYDFVIIDLQHAAYTWPEIENMCFRIRAEGAAVFVRLASQEAAEINLALDLPIDGIIIPNIASLEQAKAALAQTKFPPTGERSLGNERHDVIWDAYAQPEPMIGMLVEHINAVEVIDDIFDLPIEFAWIGTHDLSASMGLDPHDALANPPPPLIAAVDRVRAAAKAKGVHFWAAEKGAHATITGVDARLIRRAAEAALEATKERLA